MKTRPEASSGQPTWLRGAVAFLGWSFGLLLGVAAAMLILAYLFYRSDLIMPGVQTFGVDLGGKSRAEAAAALQDAWERQTITLVGEKRTRIVSPQELGLSLDVAATIETAYQRGRSPAALQTALKNRGRISVWPIWQIDLVTAEQTLQQIAPQFAVQPVNAGGQIVGGRAETTPPVPGEALDVPATMARLQQNIVQVAMGGRLEVALVPVEPAITDTSDLVAQLNQLLTNPLSIRLYDPIRDEAIAWSVTPEVWGSWLSFNPDSEDATRLNWQVRPARVQDFLVGQAESFGSERYLDLGESVPTVVDAITGSSWQVRLRVYHHSRQHIVQPGETMSSIGYDYGIPYPWIQQANPGVENLFAGQTLIIPSPDELIPLPVVEHKRIILSLSQQKMWAYENGAAKWEWPVSTGISSSPTSPGIFQIQTHQPNAYASIWDLWMPHFMGIYRPVPTSDFMNGFHGFPTRSGHNLLWTDDLGHPVTYGCVLISSDNAAALYDWAEEGIVVEIQK
jgi:lipoprotein-anchoring transpeptidase ErfK/SrfK